MIIIKGKNAEAKIMIDNIEEECTKQILEFTNHIAFNKNIVIMPDTHSGKGAVIGFTMPAETKVIPNVIGVDIGCGMCSVPTGISMCKEDLEKINEEIIRKVPTGFNLITGDISKDFDFKKVERKTNKLLNIMGFEKYKLEPDYIEKLMEKLSTNEDTVFKSLGTLGGGNHFIEIGDNGDEDFVTIHTGSRNLGKKVCEYHQKACPAMSHKGKELYFHSVVEMERYNKEEGIEIVEEMQVDENY